MIDEEPQEDTSGLIRFRLRRRRIRPELLTILVILSIGSVALYISDQRLERMLEQEQARVEGLAELVEEADQGSFSRADFEAARAELEDVLADTAERVRSLEESAGARARVIAEASASVLFIQGSYGFVDPDSGRPLRYFYGQGERPLRLPDGRTQVTTGGDGPLVQIFYTGTAFVVREDGLVATNRHVAYPWEFEPNAQFTLNAGFAADRRNLIGFLPGVEQAVELEPVAASDDADVALLRIRPRRPRAPVGGPVSGASGSLAGKAADAAGGSVAEGAIRLTIPPPLPIGTEVPAPGDEVVVMGYPAGVEALLARADPKFAEGLLARGPVTFWDVGQALSVGGYIEPLNTQGIVGQVTGAMIVYDAETTSGGSGGPVVALDGSVVAINTAILSQFAGSNLGVPARHVRSLIDVVPVSAGEASGR
jgi:S1-C subfamily serine protease